MRIYAKVADAQCKSGLLGGEGAGRGRQRPALGDGKIYSIASRDFKYNRGQIVTDILEDGNHERT